MAVDVSKHVTYVPMRPQDGVNVSKHATYVVMKPLVVTGEYVVVIIIT